MSKHKRRQKARRSFPWPVMAFGGILLILAVVLFARGNGAGGSGGSGPATISVDQQKIDYGYVKFGNNKQFRLRVTNTGAGTLRFTDKPYVEVLEGC